jgi:hypothetical protein
MISKIKVKIVQNSNAMKMHFYLNGSGKCADFRQDGSFFGPPYFSLQVKIKNHVIFFYISGHAYSLLYPIYTSLRATRVTPHVIKQ